MRSIIAALFATLVTVGAADAQDRRVIKDAKTCERGLQDAKDMRTNSDAGPKVNQAADLLLEAGTTLCEAKRYDEADRTVALVRGMLATE